MKIDGKLFLWGAVFYAFVGVLYGWWTYIDDGMIDVIGTTALAFTAFLAILVGFYFTFTANRIGSLPEDDANADIEEADPDYGFYSPHSWWPLALGASVAIVAFGFVFAAWLVAFGVAAVLFSVWGFVFEYYRGDHAH
jgi:hypothetical protein